MLDITTIRSGLKNGARYYTKEENYYSQDPDIQEMTASVNFGGLAPKHYDADVFTKMFSEGILPSGDRMRGEMKGEGQERLAYDLTFKVPGKSLSMAIHGPNGDKRLWDAHLETIKEILAIIEEKYAAARIHKDGERKVIKTGNIAATLVNHHESRAGDPHVHTHVVLFNGTLCPDGKHRALYIEPLIKSGILGDLYHQKLALKVQALGYEIEETKNGFELAGVTREQIEAFSKRSTEIDDYLKEKGWDNTPENRQKAVFETRIAKDPTETLNDKQARWSEEMASVGFHGITPADHPITPRNQETPEELLEAAIEHYSQTQSSFSVEDIQRFVFSHLRSFDEKPLDEAIENHPDLLDTWGGRLTTKEAVRRDVRILDTWMKGNGTVQALNTAPDFTGTILREGQAEAMRRLLTSPDKYQILRGLAGTGKTTALSIAKEQIPEEFTIRVFAATHDAKNSIAEAFGMEGQTIAQLAVSKPTFEKNQLWILDESGMVGSKDFEMVLAKAAQVGARVWAVGDTGQNGAIAAGAPVRMLMHRGATVHRLEEIIRQQEPEQRKAVELVARGHGIEALEALNKQGLVKEVRETSKISEAVQLYMARPQKRRDRTLVVIGTNRERREFTEELREALIDEGRLTQSTEFVQLINRNLSDAQKKRAENYRKGDILVLHEKHRNFVQLKTHTPYRVLAVEGQKLRVVSPDKKQYLINPKQHRRTEVYWAEMNEIAVGDKLRFISTNKKKGIYTNAYLRCTKIEGSIATVEGTKGQIHHLDLNKPQFIDHDWATTSNRSQGGTSDETIYISSLNPTSARESFYVAISRNRTKHLTVVTESIEKLKEWVGTSNAQKNAYETLFDPLEGWKPDYEGVKKPLQLDTGTWTEMQGSGVHPSLLTTKHLRTVPPSKGESIRSNVLVSALLEQEFEKPDYGAGQEITGPMKEKLYGIKKTKHGTYRNPEIAYERIAKGGGWIGYGGTDLLSVIEGSPQPSEYCQVKPKDPRIIQGKEVKYETPKGTDQQVFMPHIPPEIEEMIYQRNAISPTTEERAKGIWYVADQYNLPIVITEGLKKTWSSLSQGHLTVGLPGVTALYRAKDEHKKRLPKREFTKYGQALAKPGRQITFAFDNDSKISSILNVRRDLVRTLEFMQASGAICKIAKWKDDKGLDDLIVNQGPRAYNVAIANAVDPEPDIQRHYRTEYNRITKKAKRKLGPDTPKERLDMEVYAYCIKEAELNDAHRFISSSDHMRQASPEHKKQYLLAIHRNFSKYQKLTQKDKPVNADTVNNATVDLVNSHISQQFRKEAKKKILLQQEQDFQMSQRESYTVSF